MRIWPIAIILVLPVLLGRAVDAAEPWTTYRGNAQRTGNTDGRPGPSKPRVHWVQQGQDHFVAAPVPHEDRMFVSGLGAFNVSTFSAVAIEPKAAKRLVWSKTTPYLKLPTVSSPAVSDGMVLFGDGMHQTDGAVLHCLRSDTGFPLWQLPVPGSLVHLEGCPTVVEKQVLIGGGAAGVLCVDRTRVTLEGKEYDLPAVQKVLALRWKELLAKYEDEKKKDPDFAIPPNEDQLPKPAPRLLWQKGKEQWHVDAPVNVSGERVVVASSFLDKERLGDRALICLDRKTGETRWRTPLRLNPWGGAALVGNVLVVGGSTIGFDPKELTAARGDIAAYDLVTGKQLWHREMTGGIVSCVALADGLAVAAATNGRVSAFDIKTGELRWAHEAKAGFFAPPAVAAGMAYVGDLNGVLHALDCKTGKATWTLDLGADATVRAPGMIYGGPVLHGGRLFVATCNLEGPHAREPTALVCIGD